MLTGNHALHGVTAVQQQLRPKPGRGCQGLDHLKGVFQFLLVGFAQGRVVFSPVCRLSGKFPKFQQHVLQPFQCRLNGLHQ